MNSPLSKRYYRLSRASIAYLRFILESYDGLLFVRTLDSVGALVEIAYPPSRAVDAEALLTALSAEIPLLEVPPPPAEDYRPL